jgi:hypothetical protein
MRKDGLPGLQRAGALSPGNDVSADRRDLKAK